MIPSPAPVIAIQPASAINLLNSTHAM